MPLLTAPAHSSGDRKSGLAYSCGRRYQILTRAYHLLLLWLFVDLALRWSTTLGAPMVIRDCARIGGTLLLVVLVVGEALIQLREQHPTPLRHPRQ